MMSYKRILCSINQEDDDASCQALIAIKLSEVHHYAFAICDLVDALPEHSGQLSADKLDQVKANVKDVDTLAQRLDANGDANDKDGVKTNVTKLQKLLESIRLNYSTTDVSPVNQGKTNTK
jgi:hypothetical protein